MRPPLASDLFANAMGTSNNGSLTCHWCGAACSPQWRHDDPGPQPFSKQRLPAKFPHSLFVCRGCWMYRRPSYTVRFLDDTFQDRQTGYKHSWFLTDRGAWVVRKIDGPYLLEKLMSPPLRFSLSLTDGSIPNYLQLALVNNVTEVQADTPLSITVNNVPFTYTVYELEDAIRCGVVEGKEAGVRELIRFLGDQLPPPIQVEEPKRGRGEREERPGAKDVVKRIVTKSGK